MRNKNTMLNLGLFAILAVALAGAANAELTCPTPACTGGTPETCLGSVTSDNGPIACVPLPGVAATCNTPALGNPVTIIAVHTGGGPPTSCVWSCTDADGPAFKEFCGISDVNSDLPVTLFSFSVGDDAEDDESESGDEEPTSEG